MRGRLYRLSYGRARAYPFTQTTCSGVGPLPNTPLRDLVPRTGAVSVSPVGGDWAAMAGPWARVPDAPAAAENRPPRSCLQVQKVLDFILPYTLPDRHRPFLPMLLIALSNSR